MRDPAALAPGMYATMTGDGFGGTYARKARGNRGAP
jgi:hypothetical protein